MRSAGLPAAATKTRVWGRIMAGWTARAAAWAALAVGGSGLVWVLDEYLRHVAILVVLYAVLALTWDIVARTGQLSLAHAAFFGLGAYTSALTYTRLGLAPLWSLVAGGVVAAAAAGGIGWLTLRLRGIHFAIATLAVGEVLKTAALQLRSLTNGAIGISVPPLFGGERVPAYYLVLGMLAVALAMSEGMQSSPLRFALSAMRTNEEVARATGVPAVAIKAGIFAASSFLVGVAGAFYLHYTTYIVPEEVFNLAISVSALVMPILGGLYSTAGPLIGAVALKTLEEYLRVTITYGYLIAYGLMLALAVLFMPRGLLGVWRAWRSSMSRG